MLTYEELVRDLFPRLTGGIRWGLERTTRLLAAAGDPHRRFATLHVGGTNGKGSVAATMAAVLRAAGLRTGLYTSPHLCSFRERIQVDGQPVGVDELLAAARRIWPAVEAEAPSFFEATTAIAFLALAEADVDVAVVEVGLGGRLDSTNVITPEVVTLTNVALDHAQYLGSTLPAIAAEKAGIIKPGVPVVTAETDPVQLEVFARRARELGALLHAFDPATLEGVHTSLEGTRFRLRTGAWGELDLETALIGVHQAANTALAVRALELLGPALRPSREAVLEGVRSVRWPGRLQVERIGGVCWVFDVAHNPAGVQALVAALAELHLPRPIVPVLGILGDKDWKSMLPPLLCCADAAILTVPPTAPVQRLWDPQAALAAVPDQHATVVADFYDALRLAWTLAGGVGHLPLRALREEEEWAPEPPGADADTGTASGAPGGTVLVTGSFHTVGDALAALGRPPSVSAPLPGAALAL